MERRSKAVQVSRPEEKVHETIVRQAWFAITEIEYNGEVTQPDEISINPVEQLVWAEENLPYRVFVEICGKMDVGDYPFIPLLEDGRERRPGNDSIELSGQDPITFSGVDWSFYDALTGAGKGRRTIC